MNNVMTDNNTINAKLDLLLAMTSANAGRPEYTRGKETTLDELALIWFDLKKNSVCESSYGSYLRQYQTISKKFGKCYLATIKRKDIQSWLNVIAVIMSKITLMFLFYVLNSIMLLAVRDNYIWECKIVCVKSNCADLFYAPYWGKQLKGWISNGKT